MKNNFSPAIDFIEKYRAGFEMVALVTVAILVNIAMISFVGGLDKCVEWV